MEFNFIRAEDLNSAEARGGENWKQDPFLQKICAVAEALGFTVCKSLSTAYVSDSYPFNRAYFDNPKVPGVSLGFQIPYNKKTHVHVYFSALNPNEIFPFHKRQQNISPSEVMLAADSSINVSLKKDADKLLSDVQRRLIPAYEEFYSLAYERAKRYYDAETAHVSSFESLQQAFPSWKSYGDNEIYNRFQWECIMSAKAVVNHGNSFSISLNCSDLEQVKKILQLVDQINKVE